MTAWSPFSRPAPQVVSVLAGENTSAVARRLHVSVAELVDVNRDRRLVMVAGRPVFAKLREGDLLVIPQRVLEPPVEGLGRAGAPCEVNHELGVQNDDDPPACITTGHPNSSPAHNTAPAPAPGDYCVDIHEQEGFLDENLLCGGQPLWDSSPEHAPPETSIEQTPQQEIDTGPGKVIPANPGESGGSSPSGAGPWPWVVGGLAAVGVGTAILIKVTAPKPKRRGR